MQKTVRAAIASSFVMVLFSAGVSPASAESDVERIAQTVNQLAPDSLRSAELDQITGGVGATFAGGGTMTLPLDANDGVTWASADGQQSATMQLPGASSLHESDLASDGSMSFAGSEHTPAVNVLIASDAVRFSAVIENETQTESLSYDFGEGVNVEIHEDGSATVYILEDNGRRDEAALETVIAEIEAPWAYDSKGSPVETFYAADEGVLTQIVKHSGENVTYPVVADPTFDSPAIFQSRVRFNRAETQTIADLGLASLGGAVCGPMAPVCIAAGLVLAYNAGVASNSNPKICTQITLTSIPGTAPFWWVDNYSGGPC